MQFDVPVPTARLTPFNPNAWSFSTELQALHTDNPNDAAMGLYRNRVIEADAKHSLSGRPRAAHSIVRRANLLVVRTNRTNSQSPNF